jgi:aspartate carbamoyltransferase catalytic subunit
MAQCKLGMKVIYFDIINSSIQKKEEFYDTIKTFDNFSSDLLVIRHSKEKYWEDFKKKLNTPIINAGDGSGNHPTQSLLDLLTIKEEFSTFSGLTIGIIGDIINSRVARTNINIMKKLGMKILISGPEQYLPDISKLSGVNYMPFPDILPKCDIIMMLRIQTERHTKIYNFSKQEYNKYYGLNTQNFNMIKPSAIIMHPGPVNRNVEISDNLVECKNSRILKQVKNGVFIRMATICYVFDLKF